MSFRRVVYVQDWSDYRVRDLTGDVMLPVATGVYFHHRLQLLIVLKDEILPSIAANLPD